MRVGAWIGPARRIATVTVTMTATPGGKPPLTRATTPSVRCRSERRFSSAGRWGKRSFAIEAEKERRGSETIRVRAGPAPDRHPHRKTDVGEPGRARRRPPSGRHLNVRSPSRHAAHPSFTPRSLSALPTTETEDSDIAAAAKIGESRMPKNGYRTPAAIGTPAAL